MQRDARRPPVGHMGIDDTDESTSDETYVGGDEGDDDDEDSDSDSDLSSSGATVTGSSRQ